jgi:hypothetical protein
MLSRRRFLQIVAASAGAAIAGSGVTEALHADGSGATFVRGVAFFGAGNGALYDPESSFIGLSHVANVTHANWVVFNPFWNYYSNADPMGTSTAARRTGWPSNEPVLNTSSYQADYGLGFFTASFADRPVLKTLWQSPAAASYDSPIIGRHGHG